MVGIPILRATLVLRPLMPTARLSENDSPGIFTIAVMFWFVSDMWGGQAPLSVGRRLFASFEALFCALDLALVALYLTFVTGCRINLTLAIACL